MTSAWKNLAWPWLAAVAVSSSMMCGCVDDEPTACASSPLVGHYLWNIGNCESGSITPVSADTCGVTLCGGNARESAECTGDKLFDVDVSGLQLTSGETVEAIELTRALDCANISVSAETCALWQCMIAHDPDVYVQRLPQRAADEQFHPDGLWVLMDEAWPARNGCADSSALEARFGELATTCNVAM